MFFRDATSVVLSLVALQGLTHVAVGASAAAARRPTTFDGNATVLAYLEGIANYTAALDLPSNSLRNASGGHIAGSTDSIFINGNLARVLLATYRLQDDSSKNPEYLRQGLGWCDTFVQLQADIESSNGNAAGYWGTGYGQWANCTQRPLRGDCAHSGDIYFGDTGTAVTALALCYRLAGETEKISLAGESVQQGRAVATDRKSKYMEALEKYAAFVLEGSATAPVNKKGVVRSFVDPHSGAVGCGYYACLNRTEENCANVPGDVGLNCPSTHPYTIATGTTGGAFFAEMYNLTGNITYGDLAAAAMQYEASVALPSGEVPYILDGLNCTTALGSEGCHSVGGPWP